MTCSKMSLYSKSNSGGSGDYMFLEDYTNGKTAPTANSTH